MLPQWLTDEIDTVPEYDVFLGAAELEDELAQIASTADGTAVLRRVGSSRLGHPIHCLTVGAGDEDAVVFGLPHPNEPVGGLTALHLARRLCADADLREYLGHRWHIVACIDPDGLHLNEGWLRGPFTRAHHARHFYRPAGAEQVEWAFPLNHKLAYFDRVLPETLAVMQLIDQHRPRLLASLHNSELGGAYYYLGRRAPALHPILQELPGAFGIPLDRGEPESPVSEKYADGLFGALSLAELYDDAETHGHSLPLGAGDTSHAYARRHGTFTLVSEVPYWTDERFADQSPGRASYGEILRAQADDLAELATTMSTALSAVADDLWVDSAFLRASRFFARMLTDQATTVGAHADQPSSDRTATVAEEASITDVAHGFRLRYGGMLARLLEAEIAIGNVCPTVVRTRASVAAQLERWHEAARAVDHSHALPIRCLVGTQYGAILATARHLHTG